MGRATRAGGSGERGKTIGKPRTKRRKRKDLEELHRNALEAKRNLGMQAPEKKKLKTTLRKVLHRFADARQANEDSNHGLADKQSGKKKARTICNRLLPEQIFGIYQNGVKGHEVRRANQDFSKIKTARLEGDVLKLLNGDETDPKLPWNGNEKRTDDSDNTDTPVLDEMKGVRSTNREKRKKNLIAKNAVSDTKNEQQQFFQRENNCKRRLFVPNEDNSIDSCCLGNAAGKKNLPSDDTRFPTPWGVPRNVSPSKDFFGKRDHRAELAEAKAQKTAMKNRSEPIDGDVDPNSWGWSPSIFYETLCAKISEENFEKPEEPRSRDPLVKIRRALREFYRNNRRHRQSDRKTVIDKGNVRREQPKVSFPLENPNFSSTTEIQACTADSEMDQETSDSGASKVDSWRPRHFGEMYSQKDLIDTNETPLKSEDKEHKSKVDKLMLLNRQNHRQENRTNGVEKTIHEVTAFLERLREDKPLNEKGNIFDVEMARVSQQKEHLTSDMKLRNVQRNTKHVPTILRRSNSRYNFVEVMNEKQRPLSTDLPLNAPKRSTRTTCAISRRREHVDFDKNPTPSIVAYRAALKEPKPNVPNPKLNVEATFRPMARSSVFQDLDELTEKHRKTIAKEKDSSSRVFVNTTANDHEWRHSEQHRQPTLENHSEKERQSRTIDFDMKKDIRDFYESNLRMYDTNVPESNNKYQLSGSTRHENPRYSSFEFVCPEVSKKFDLRDNRSFAKKMDDFRPLPEVSRQVSLTAIDPRLTDVGPSASQQQHSNAIPMPPEGYVERVATDKNRSFQPLRSYHQTDALSLDRPPRNEAAGCNEHSRGVAVRHQRIRKPVMLFRPIPETHQQQEICDPRYRFRETAEETINDAVTNLRVLTFDENTVDQATRSQTYDAPCEPQWQHPQPQQQSFCHPHFVDNTQPSKYRAVDAPDGRNPRRLPIYLKADDKQFFYAVPAQYNCRVETSNASNAPPKSETSEIVYLRSCDMSDPKMQNLGKVQYCGKDRQLQEQWSHQANQVSFVVPCTAPYYQQPSTNPSASAASVGLSNGESIPKVVYSMTPCETVVPVEMRYKLQPQLYHQSHCDNQNLAKRIQLPDGRIGIIVTDNCEMNNPNRLNRCESTSSTIHVGNINAINRSGLPNERIYY